MSWSTGSLVQRWEGEEFPEPTDEELKRYEEPIRLMDWAKCGRPSGVIAHRRAGEQPCGPCLAAATRDATDRRKSGSSSRRSTERLADDFFDDQEATG